MKNRQRLDGPAAERKEENRKKAVRMTVILGIVAIVLVLAMMVEVYL